MTKIAMKSYYELGDIFKCTPMWR